MLCAESVLYVQQNHIPFLTSTYYQTLNLLNRKQQDNPKMPYKILPAPEELSIRILIQESIYYSNRDIYLSI